MASYNRLSEQLAFEIGQLLFLYERQIVLIPGVRVRIRVRELIAVVVLVERKQYAQHIVVVVIQRPVVVHPVNRYARPETKKVKSIITVV